MFNSHGNVVKRYCCRRILMAT